MPAKPSISLIEAADAGTANTVNRLLETCTNSRSSISWALRQAAGNGHVEVVKLLLPVSDSKVNNSLALQWAVENGHMEIIKLLLPVSDPKANRSWALRQAAENGHMEIVRLLLPHSDYTEALTHPGFIGSSGCDLLLSCLSEQFAKQFMVDNPDFDLPRTRAMLASQGLSNRESPIKSVATKRLRA